MFPTNLTYYSSGIRDFCWRHRTKLVVGASVVAGAALLYSYSGYLFDEDELLKDTSLKVRPKSIDNTKRSAILRRIRKENDITMKFFLTTLRAKINEVVDISGITRQIRALRENPVSDSSDVEADLWENLKVSSFTSTFVSCYLISVVCVLVVVQRHILASRLPSVQASLTNSDNISDIRSHPEEGDLMDMFSSLISKSYDHLFSTGMQNFADKVREIVRLNLKDWSAGSKLEVEFSELVLMIVSIRRCIDVDLSETVRSLIIPNDAKENQENMIKSDTPSAATEFDPADTLLNQTWDVVELPLFDAVLKEALDCCFENFFVDLRRSVYAPGNPLGHSPLKKPPLASLLPPLKTISLRLTEGSTDYSSVDSSATFPVWKQVLNGVLLEELCVGVFDSICAAS